MLLSRGYVLVCYWHSLVASTAGDDFGGIPLRLAPTITTHRICIDGCRDHSCQRSGRLPARFPMLIERMSDKKTAAVTPRLHHGVANATYDRPPPRARCPAEETTRTVTVRSQRALDHFGHQPPTAPAPGCDWLSARRSATVAARVHPKKRVRVTDCLLPATRNNSYKSAAIAYSEKRAKKSSTALMRSPVNSAENPGPAGRTAGTDPQRRLISTSDPTRSGQSKANCKATNPP